MQYDVFLDDLYFYGVTDFSFSGDREVMVYNGIGTGYFPKLDDPNLQKWSWTCELQEKPEHYHGSDFLPATQIFERLNEMKASLEPVRLVVKGENKSLSELVGLEGYTYKELYNGVYQVAVNVTEYKEAAVRTTTIPEIPRPGKIPQKNPFNIPEGSTPYDEMNKGPESFEQESNPSGSNPEAVNDPGGGKAYDPVNDVLTDSRTGQEIPVPVDWGDELLFFRKDDGKISFNQGKAGNILSDAWDAYKNSGLVRGIDSVLDGISDAYNRFMDNTWESYLDSRKNDKK